MSFIARSTWPSWFGEGGKPEHRALFGLKVSLAPTEIVIRFLACLYFDFYVTSTESYKKHSFGPTKTKKGFFHFRQVLVRQISSSFSYPRKLHAMTGPDTSPSSESLNCLSGVDTFHSVGCQKLPSVCVWDD